MCFPFKSIVNEGEWEGKGKGGKIGVFSFQIFHMLEGFVLLKL